VYRRLIAGFRAADMDEVEDPGGISINLLDNE
jgi:hypothetical protein